MGTSDPRPALWIGHVVMESDVVAESAAFLATLGLRTVWANADMAILELRGGTHLLVFPKGRVPGGAAPFDLMVEDLPAFHARLVGQGLAPGAIEHVSAMHHDRFTLREPGGNLLTFYSSHVDGREV